MTKFRYTVTEKDKGKPVKDLVRSKFTFSARMMTKLRLGDGILLNGKPTEGWVTPALGDEITISLPRETSYFQPEDIPINVVYEDSDLLVINKQPGFTVHPTGGQPSGTMANGVMKYMLDRGDSFKIRFVNRLDRDTSGLLIVGKNAHAQHQLTLEMKENRVNKVYVAVARGILNPLSGTIDLPIGKADYDSPNRAVKDDGHPSVTHYETLETFGLDYSLVSLRLETGRTHQIRVHLSHLGHPIVGDSLYCGEDTSLINRQALHAKVLEFKHPTTGRDLHLEAPMPKDMEDLIKKLKL